MKRITKSIRKLDILSTIFDWLYIAIAFVALVYLFSLLEAPRLENEGGSGLTEVISTTYEFVGFTITSTQANLFISLIVFYFIIFVPNAVINTKRLRNKDEIDIDEWTYRTQFLYMFLAFFSGNIPSAVLRYKVGFGIKWIYKGYGFKQTMIDIYKGIKSLFDKKTYTNFAKKRKSKLKLTDSQQDLEYVSRVEFAKTVVRLVVTYAFLTFVALFIFIPFYWMMLTALKTYDELSTSLNPRFFIGLSEMQWVNFKTAVSRLDFGLYIWNTIYVGVLSTVGTILTTVLAAFAFARLEFKGRDFIFSILLMTMMIPGELYVITNFITVSRLGWLNTFSALIIPFMTSVFYIFFLRQTFKQIPDSLYRAAQVDGCGDFKYLSRVMIPIAKPTIITITILSAIGAWDAFIWPQLVARDRSYWLISVALRLNTSFNIGTGDQARPIYNLQMAANALVTVPLIIIFFLLKKYIMAGVGRSGTKG
jgi:ABC-type glycerol-3-phosphate transport system permease component